jgi:hypothetical protein
MESSVNSSDISHTLQKWIDDVLPTVSLHTPASIHVNELIGRQDSVYNPTYTNVSIQLFLALVEAIVALSNVVQPVLVIPLEPKDLVDRESIPRNVEDIEKDAHKLEPPGLYLLDWRAYATPWITEEYKMPLALSMLRLPPLPLYVYYRAYRLPVDGLVFPLLKEWNPLGEYERCIYVEYWGKR